jgi:RNA recognition motif-containing protein
VGIKIFVGNLSRQANSRQLQTLFEPFGTVKWAEVASEPSTGACRGFGFVMMDSPVQARVAVTNLNGRPFHGRMLRVGEAGIPLTGPGRAATRGRRRAPIRRRSG